MKDVDIKSKLNDALLKKAMGFCESDITEEYIVVENELVLSKKKVNKKTYAPDINAIQMCLQLLKDVNDYSHLSIEELEIEKEKLLKLLNDAGNSD